MWFSDIHLAVLLNMPLVSLNPCFNGCGSRTKVVADDSEMSKLEVSILVLMDVVLGRRVVYDTEKRAKVSILVLMDVVLGQLYKLHG